MFEPMQLLEVSVWQWGEAGFGEFESKQLLYLCCGI